MHRLAIVVSASGLVAFVILLPVGDGDIIIIIIMIVIIIIF